MEKEKDSYEAQYIVKRNVKLEKLSSIPYNHSDKNILFLDIK